MPGLPPPVAGPSHPHTNQAPVIDAQMLLENCMGNTALVTMLFERFEKQVREDIVSIRRSLLQGDTEQTARTSHALKGAAGALAAAGVQSAAAVIEQAARESQLDAAAKGFEQLKTEVDRCLACLPATLAAMPDQGALK